MAVSMNTRRWIVAGAVVLALIVLGGFVIDARNQSTAEADYLDFLAEDNVTDDIVPEYGETAVVDMGRSICARLEDGMSVENVMDVLREEGRSTQQAEGMVRGATWYFCSDFFDQEEPAM
jgi:hypothetical protein